MKHKAGTSTFHWLFAVSNKIKLGIAALVLCNSLLSVSSVLFALVIKRAIDSAIGQAEHDFLLYSLALGALLLAQIALRAVVRFTDERVRAGLENSMKLRAYHTILGRDYAALSGFHTGELQNRMTNDTVVIADGMTTILPAVVAMLVKLIGAFAVLMKLDSDFALIFLAGGICFLLLTYPFRRVLKRMHKQVQESDDKLRSFLQETLGNLVVLRCFGSEEMAAAGAEQRMNVHKAARHQKARFSNLCNIGFGLVMNGGYWIGLVWCGRGILRGSLSYGTLTAVLQLIGQIQQPFSSMTGYLPKYYAMLASAERMIALEQLPEDAHAEAMTTESIRLLGSTMDEIRLSGVTFSYPDKPQQPVLCDADLSIQKGEFVAFTGTSGIGKSTLLKLLLAVYQPMRGRMEVLTRDGTEVPLNAASRRLFAYVPQGNCLLSGTIAEAVSLANGQEPDMDKVRYACRVACADAFIEALPDQYESRIGERGAGLSEGQLQRIAVARAIYAESPVLLLDEATSALDERTEEQLLKNLRNMTDCTVLIVTHRQAALRVCTRVIALENHKIRERGGRL